MPIITARKADGYLVALAAGLKTDVQNIGTIELELEPSTTSAVPASSVEGFKLRPGQILPVDLTGGETLFVKNGISDDVDIKLKVGV
jgi:hypothetical protein